MRKYVKETKAFYVGAIAADSDALLYALWKVSAPIKIVAVKLGVDADNTKQNTDYNTVELKGGTVVIAAIANGPVAGGTTILKGTFGDMVVNVAAAECDVAADSTLTLKVTKTGNGLAYAGAIIQVEYYPN